MNAPVPSAGPRNLRARRIVLGVSGGIAAYKAVQLLRLLTARGHDVMVVPTMAALEFVGRSTFEALSAHPVHTSVFEAGGAEHVRLGRASDLIVVAPATADFMARAAAGRADDLLTATLLMAHGPVLMAPAMHTEMWQHPATRDNVGTLMERGIVIVGPDVGPLAGGDSGEGRMLEPEEIAAAVDATLATMPDDEGLASAPGASSPGSGDEAQKAGAPGADLAGRNVVVTAGGTREAIDPVRYIGNRSSGKQGIALAQRALARGARVRLIIANPTTPIPPELVDLTTRVGNSAELSSETRKAAKGADIVVMAAAVSDFRPSASSESKLKREGRQSLAIELEPTEDILAGLVARRRSGQVIVGFAAETGDAHHSPEELGRLKAKAKGADLLVCNEVGETKGFDTADNQVVIFDAAGRIVERASGGKPVVADVVWSAAVGLLGGR